MAGRKSIFHLGCTTSRSSLCESREGAEVMLAPIHTDFGYIVSAALFADADEAAGVVALQRVMACSSFAGTYCTRTS